MTEHQGKAKGGFARSQNMSPEKRSEIARKAALAKSEKAKMPEVTHQGELKIGEITLPCYVTSDGERVISGLAMQDALRLVDETPPQSGKKPGDRVSRLLNNKALFPYISKDGSVAHLEPVKVRYSENPKPINGYRAEGLADICEGVLEARRQGLITSDRLKLVAEQCEILIRGFARVGIIALVDEATGYQRDREKNALAKILEAFVAKELQPYVKTFPAEYYEELFRLRGLPYPPENPRFRPQYFGVLTNDIVYERIAPGLLEELKKQAAKDEKKAHLHRRLTQEVGHPKLREHLASVVTAMKLSSDYGDFITKLNRLHPRFGNNLCLDLKDEDR